MNPFANWGLGYRGQETLEWLREQLLTSGQTTGGKRNPENVYYVDDVNGLDANDGLSPATPFKTIMKGLNMARRITGSTTIDDTKDHQGFVFVAPGHYNEQLLFSGYGVHLVGLGSPVPGKDYGVSINYSGAVVAAPSVVAFTGSGNSIRNVHVTVGAVALPAIYMAVPGDNNLIEGCVLEGDGATATVGIEAESLKGSWIRGCVINGFVTAGIRSVGVADSYAINGGIEDCQIFAPTAAGAKGIFMDVNMVAYNFRINHNFIDVKGGGATGKGIDLDFAGLVFVTDNYIVAAAGTVFEAAQAGGVFNNHTYNGTNIIDPNRAAA